jgi:hypothetical protein
LPAFNPEFMLLQFLLLLNLLLFPPPDWRTPYEKSNGQQTATYEECINYYQQIDEAYDEIKLFSYGLTDSGRPLHLVVISLNQDFEPPGPTKTDRPAMVSGATPATSI